jgi:hypothetical protein
MLRACLPQELPGYEWGTTIHRKVAMLWSPAASAGTSSFRLRHIFPPANVVFSTPAGIENKIGSGKRK